MWANGKPPSGFPVRCLGICILWGREAREQSFRGIAAIPGCRLQLCITAAAMVALVLLARIGLWLHCTLRYLRRASPEQTAEISICGFPQSQRPKVCIIYDQQMLVCFNVGNLPAVLPANMISMPAARQPTNDGGYLLNTEHCG